MQLHRSFFAITLHSTFRGYFTPPIPKPKNVTLCLQHGINELLKKTQNLRYFKPKRFKKAKEGSLESEEENQFCANTPGTITLRLAT